MILYFTGTGNSKYVADALGHHLSDAVVSLNGLIQQGIAGEFISEKPYVIVAPIYAWRLPLVVEEYLKNASFAGSKKVYVVATMESQTGRADLHCEKLFTGLDMEFMGFIGIRMPNNYVIMSKMPEAEEVETILSKARPLIKKVSNAIRKEGRLRKIDITPFGRLVSGAGNKMFYKFFVSDKKYEANDNCIGCGACKNVCPMNNIEMVDGKPTFSGNCTACYACIQHCPTEALNIKGRTEKHGRYVCPEFSPEE